MVWKQGSTPDVLVLSTAAARLAALEGKGISRCSLPACIGGTLSHNFHENWIRCRMTVEEMLGSVFFNNRALSTSHALSSPSSSALVASSRPRSSKKNQSTPLAPKQRAHQRWLEKERLKKSALDEQYELEQMQNAQLVATHQRLSNLLAEAKYIVALHTSKSS